MRMTNTDKVINALLAANGKPRTTEQIAAACNLTPRQTMAAIGSARRNPANTILTPRRGIYLTPPPKDGPKPVVIPDDSPTPSLMEYVGRSKSGSLIVRDEAGRLYLATPVDL